MNNFTLNLGQQRANFIFEQNKARPKVKAWESKTQEPQGTLEINKTIHTKLYIYVCIYVYSSTYGWIVLYCLISNYP